MKKIILATIIIAAVFGASKFGAALEIQIVHAQERVAEVGGMAGITSAE